MDSDPAPAPAAASAADPDSAPAPAPAAAAVGGPNAALSTAIAELAGECDELIRDVEARPAVEIESTSVRWELSEKDAQRLKQVEAWLNQHRAHHTYHGRPAPPALSEEQLEAERAAMVPRLVTYSVKNSVDSATLLSKLECAPLQAALLPVDDLFNDNISYKLETYADLKRLAPLLGRVARKYSMFGESPAATPVLASLKRDIVTLRAGLQQARALLEPPRSVTGDVLLLMGRANALVRDAAEMGAVFQAGSASSNGR